MVFFKYKGHFEDMLAILKKMGIENYKYNEYLSFAYLISATRKTSNIMNFIDDEGIEVDKLKESIGVYSSSEKAMIRFAMTLFNQYADDISLENVFLSLDDENTKVVIKAIKIRFDNSVAKLYKNFIEENLLNKSI